MITEEHLDDLTPQHVAALKSHANAATHEDHYSFQTIRNWLGTLGLGVVTAGGVWKAIKTIKLY